MNINDSPQLYCGGYYEQGDRNNLVLLKPRQSELDAEIDAAHTAEPAEWRVVVEVEIVAVERVAPVGSNPPARRIKAKSTSKS